LLLGGCHRLELANPKGEGKKDFYSYSTMAKTKNSASGVPSVLDGGGKVKSAGSGDGKSSATTGGVPLATIDGVEEGKDWRKVNSWPGGSIRGVIG